LLSGNSDNNFSIDELENILLQLGFYERKGAGSHTLYKMDGIDDLINIQSVKGGQAKAYQIKQIRNIIIKHRLVKL
jgi:predicted RNA binding protein YcfA (HicA-like mRNA interferase family)